MFSIYKAKEKKIINMQHTDNDDMRPEYNERN